MDAIWDRIEAWLAANAPAVLASLNPPATEADITATEALIGRALPDDVKAAYRRHDGQADCGGLFGGWDWLPLAEVRATWTLWTDLLAAGEFDGPASDVAASSWWDPGWVPLTHSGSGNHHCVDLTVGPQGEIRRVMTVWHDAPDRPVVADNFNAWLLALAEDLEAGVYTVCGEYGWLVHQRHL